MLWSGWDAVSRWWDGVELWLTELGLAPQVALLMLVALPACWCAVRTLDWAVGLTVLWFRHRGVGPGEGSGEPR